MSGKRHFFVLFFTIAALIQSSRAYASPVYLAPAYYCDQSSCEMTDQGGPVMTGVTDIYTIFYGAPPAYYPLEEALFYDLTGSDYMNLASLYGASTQIDWKGGYVESEYLGNSLDHDSLDTVVTDIANGDLSNVTSSLLVSDSSGISAESNAIYFIFAAPDVSEARDRDACSFHSDVEGLKFVWVGSYSAQLGLCGQGTLLSDMTAEASHELFETLTDPFVNEYYFPPGQAGWSDGNPEGEIADPCNQEDFPLSLTGVPGFSFNVQSIFVNDPSYAAGGYCASGNTFDSATASPEPATLSLFGIGLAGAAAMRRRKAKRA